MTDITSSGLKVLVVDDSQTIRRSAEMFLKQGGHRVVLAEDGFDALSKINDFQPDLVFCDILMPRLAATRPAPSSNATGGLRTFRWSCCPRATACSTRRAGAWWGPKSTSPNPSPKTSCCRLWPHTRPWPHKRQEPIDGGP